MSQVGKEPASLLVLPAELLLIIISYVHMDHSLKPLSTVNTYLRRLCVPSLFRILKVAFSHAGLNRLEQASRSKVAAPFVEVILYEVPELIDPLTQDWDLFQSCIYRPAEYRQDQKDFHWKISGGEIQYSTIYSYFSCLSREQQMILQEDRDIKVLCAALSQFSQLNTIHLHFIDGIQPPFQWFAGHVSLDGHVSFPDHLEKMIEAIIVAKGKNVFVRVFQISGFYSSVVTNNPDMQSMIQDAFSNVEDLRLIESPNLLNFFCPILLPRLYRFELRSCWLLVSELENLVHNNSKSLRLLHLQDIWMLDGNISDDRISLSMGNIQSVLDGIVKIRKSGILSELTVQDRHGFEVREVMK